MNKRGAAAAARASGERQVIGRQVPASVAVALVSKYVLPTDLEWQPAHAPAELTEQHQGAALEVLGHSYSVPSLATLAIDTVIPMLIESSAPAQLLAQLPAPVRRQLLCAAAARRQLHAAFLHPFLDEFTAEFAPGSGFIPEFHELRIPDGAELDAHDLVPMLGGSAAFAKLMEEGHPPSEFAVGANGPASLLGIDITHAGRCCTDEALAALGDTLLPRLHLCVLRGAYTLTDRGLAHALEAAGSLRALGLLHSGRLGPATAAAIAQHCRQLECLWLDATPAMDDAALGIQVTQADDSESGAASQHVESAYQVSALQFMTGQGMGIGGTRKRKRAQQASSQALPVPDEQDVDEAGRRVGPGASSTAIKLPSLTLNQRMSPLLGQQLTYLHLAFQPLVTDAVVHALVASAAAAAPGARPLLPLKHLILRHCPRITDSSCLLLGGYAPCAVTCTRTGQQRTVLQGGVASSVEGGGLWLGERDQPLVHLETLVLDTMPSISDVGVKAMAHAVRDAQRLCIVRCTGVVRESTILALLSSATHRDAAQQRSEPQHAAPAATSAASEVGHIDFGFAPRRAQPQPAAAGERSSAQLRALRLVGMPCVSDMCAALLSSSSAVQTLQYLDMSWCRGISDDALGYLVDAAVNLERADVWGCTQLSARFFAGVAGVKSQRRGVPVVLRVVGIPGGRVADGVTSASWADGGGDRQFGDDLGAWQVATTASA